MMAIDCLLLLPAAPACLLLLPACLLLLPACCSCLLLLPACCSCLPACLLLLPARPPDRPRQCIAIMMAVRCHHDGRGLPS